MQPAHASKRPLTVFEYQGREFAALTRSEARAQIRRAFPDKERIVSSDIREIRKVPRVAAAKPDVK